MEGAEPVRFVYRLGHMKATSDLTTRRVRAIAVATIMLCAFITVAPLIARSATAHHPRARVATLLTAAVADQPGNNLRLDQPATLQHGAPLAARAGTISRPGSAAVVFERIGLNALTNRGPPSAAS
jgi:hypothetical protein